MSMDWKDYGGKGQKAQYEVNQWFVKTYINELMLPENCVVLDVGCGPGNVTHDLLLPILPESAKVYAIDKCPQNIKTAQEKYNHPRIQYCAMAVEDLDKLDMEFDLIVSLFCFHFVKRQVHAWKLLGKKIKDRGTIVILTNAAPVHCYISMLELVEEEPKYIHLKEEALQFYAPYIYEQPKQSRSMFQKDVKTGLPAFTVEFNYCQHTIHYADFDEFVANMKPLNIFRHKLSEEESSNYDVKLSLKTHKKMNPKKDEYFHQVNVCTVKAVKQTDC